MNSIEEKDRVTIAYIGKLDSGDVFKEISADNPFEAVVGESELPPSVELALIGMKVGEQKRVRVPPEEGYGPRLKDLLHEVPKANFGDGMVLRPGMVLSQKMTREGREFQIPATVIEVKKDHVVIDYNHPMAGHHLNYHLTVVSVTKA